MVKWEYHAGRSNNFMILFIHIPRILSQFTLLVGGIPTPLKNMSSSLGIVNFPIYGKSSKSCSKPPTSIYIYSESYTGRLTEKKTIYLGIVLRKLPILVAPTPHRHLTAHPVHGRG